MDELPRSKCEGCGEIHLTVNLSRFGRHKRSPLFCRKCAEMSFEQLKNKLAFHVVGKKEIIEKK